MTSLSAFRGEKCVRYISAPARRSLGILLLTIPFTVWYWPTFRTRVICFHYWNFLSLCELMYSWKFLHTCLWFPRHNLIPWFHDNQMNRRHWWKGGEITGISSRGFYEKHKGNRERLLRIFANWTKLRWNKGNEQVRARSSRHPRHAQREQWTFPCSGTDQTSRAARPPAGSRSASRRPSVRCMGCPMVSHAGPLAGVPSGLSPGWGRHTLARSAEVPSLKSSDIAFIVYKTYSIAAELTETLYMTNYNTLGETDSLGSWGGGAGRPRGDGASGNPRSSISYWRECQA